MTWHSPSSEVVNKTVEAALQLVRDVQEDKLAVASKSAVIATTPNIAKQVVSSLARHDIHIQDANQAKDLGGGCVQRKKANASNHGQEMGQGGKTNEKVREVWQVDLEASQCMPLENGSLGAESLRYSDRELLKQHNAEVEAGV